MLWLCYVGWILVGWKVDVSCTSMWLLFQQDVTFCLLQLKFDVEEEFEITGAKKKKKKTRACHMWHLQQISSLLWLKK
jgi:hypothetical protein